ncbi:hypothetical protein MC885_005710, partial [Smutsia gigantea]
YLRRCPEPRSPDSLGEEWEPELHRERRSLRQRVYPRPFSGEVKQEVFGVPAEVCLRFSLSHSENGAIHPGAVSQLHCRPDHCYSDVAAGEVLSVLRGHATSLGLTAMLQSCPPTVPRPHRCHGCLSRHPTALLTCTHSI